MTNYTPRQLTAMHYDLPQSDLVEVYSDRKYGSRAQAIHFGQRYKTSRSWPSQTHHNSVLSLIPFPLIHYDSSLTPSFDNGCSFLGRGFMDV